MIQKIIVLFIVLNAYYGDIFNNIQYLEIFLRIMTSNANKVINALEFSNVHFRIKVNINLAIILR